MNRGISARLDPQQWCVTFAPNGTAYFAHSSGIIKYADGKATKVDLGKRPIGLRQILVGADGSVVARAFKEIIMEEANDYKRLLLKPKPDGTPSNPVQALFFDKDFNTWS